MNTRQLQVLHYLFAKGEIDKATILVERELAFKARAQVDKAFEHLQIWLPLSDNKDQFLDDVHHLAHNAKIQYPHYVQVEIEREFGRDKAWTPKTLRAHLGNNLQDEAWKAIVTKYEGTHASGDEVVDFYHAHSGQSLKGE